MDENVHGNLKSIVPLDEVNVDLRHVHLVLGNYLNDPALTIYRVGPLLTFPKVNTSYPESHLVRVYMTLQMFTNSGVCSSAKSRTG